MVQARFEGLGSWLCSKLLMIGIPLDFTSFACLNTVLHDFKNSCYPSTTYHLLFRFDDYKTTLYIATNGRNRMTIPGVDSRRGVAT